MHDKIKELTKQAEIKWQHQEDVIYSTMTLEQLERFAELVISECCGAFWTKECSYSDLAYEEYTKRVNTIKQHFGIE